jgi:hypothetical protein
VKILVVIGKNSFGNLVVDALRRLPDVRVFATRTIPGASECTLSLSVPTTFDGATGMDVIVNCADPLADAPPHRFADWCLRNGILFVETTSHVPTLESLFFEIRRREVEAPTSGAVLLGAGLTPGLSNLLARELSEAENIGERVELFFDGHPPLDAPLSRIEQLCESLRVNGVRYHNGERVEAAPVGPSVRLLDGKHYVRICRAEAAMLAWSGFAPTTATYVAGPRLALSATSALLKVLPERAGTRALLLAQELRARARRSRQSPEARRAWPLRVTAIAGRRGDEQPIGLAASLVVNDGDWAAACAAAIMAVDARRRLAQSARIVFADQLFCLAPLLEEMSKVAGPALSLTLESPATAAVAEGAPSEPGRRRLPIVGARDPEVAAAQVA